MASDIHCPSCRSRLRAPADSAGERFTCPRCGADVPVGPPAAPASGIQAEPGGPTPASRPSPVAVPRCPACGREVEPAWAGCPGCGTPLRPPVGEASDAPLRPTADNPVLVNVLAVIGGGALVFVGLTAGIGAARGDPVAQTFLSGLPCVLLTLAAIALCITGARNPTQSAPEFLRDALWYLLALLGGLVLVVLVLGPVVLLTCPALRC